MTDIIELCDSRIVHDDIVEQVKGGMPDDELFYELADLFKVFGDSTRVKILWALENAEMCVCDISAVLNMSQSAVSHQLRVLKQSNLVKNRREGKSIFYSLSDDHVKLIMEQGLDHINE